MTCTAGPFLGFLRGFQGEGSSFRLYLRVLHLRRQVNASLKAPEAASPFPNLRNGKRKPPARLIETKLVA